MLQEIKSEDDCGKETSFEPVRQQGRTPSLYKQGYVVHPSWLLVPKGGAISGTETEALMPSSRGGTSSDPKKNSSRQSLLGDLLLLTELDSPRVEACFLASHWESLQSYFHGLILGWVML